MTIFEPALHAGTPDVTSVGSAGSPVITLRFLRHPDENACLPARFLVTRTVTNVPTRTLYFYGPRPLRNADGRLQPDAANVTALSGQAVRLYTVDGDVTLTLTDAAGRPLWVRSAQATVKGFTYESFRDGGRLLAVSETVVLPGSGKVVTRVRERFAYDNPVSPAVKANNLAGVVIQHCDNAGYRDVLSVSLSSQPLLSKQYLLPANAPQVDWRTKDVPATEPPLTVSTRYDATGKILAQTNAAGVTTVTWYDVNGAVRENRLRYADRNAQSGTEVITLKAILHRADGRIGSQTAGNGVTDIYEYDPQTLRLVRHLTQRPAEHPLGPLLIADLHYLYDPAGNILRLEDKGADPVWHRGLRIAGQRKYAYDTLYRLVHAKGRERISAGRGRTQPAGTGLTAGGVWVPYDESYTYDDGDNLTKTVHAGLHSWTHNVTVSASSNRGIIALPGKKLDEIRPDDNFLPGGLQKRLADGRSLDWYADGQLYRVSPVTRREGEADDEEIYRYAEGGRRVRKVLMTKTAGGWLRHVTTYAGGCERRQRHDPVGRLLLDISLTEVGGARLTENLLKGEKYLYYSIGDHLNSCGGETDEQGAVICREEYYPYGGSAGVMEGKTEVAIRTRRYSGKERDATGLYYYGWRYYQTAEGRWLSADPGGMIDGINLFRFCRGNPVRLIDPDGRAPVDEREELESALKNLIRGLDQHKLREALKGWRTWPSDILVDPVDIASNLLEEVKLQIPDAVAVYTALNLSSVQTKSSDLAGATGAFDKPPIVQFTLPAPENFFDRNPTLQPDQIPAGGYINSKGFIERRDVSKLYRTESMAIIKARQEKGDDVNSFAPSGWFAGVEPMMEGAIVIAAGNRAGALCHGSGNLGNVSYALFEIETTGVPVVSFKENLNFNSDFLRGIEHDADAAAEFDEYHISHTALTAMKAKVNVVRVY